MAEDNNKEIEELEPEKRAFPLAAWAGALLLLASLFATHPPMEKRVAALLGRV